MCFGKTGYYRLLSRLVLSESLDLLSEYCSEFLIHAADVEGLCQGIDEQLVRSEPRCDFQYSWIRLTCMQSWVNGFAYQRRTREEQEVSFAFS